MSERYEIDWKFSAFPDYAAEADAWAAVVRRNAPRADDASVFIGAHQALILSRCATGRDALDLLVSWSTPGLAGHTIEGLIEASMRWHQEATRKRRDTLRRLGHILADVEHELGKRADVDPAEVAAEAEELRIEIACRVDSPIDPRPFVGMFGPAWAPAGRAVRALRRAMQAYRRAWPWREQADALNTPAKVRAAREGIARGVRP